MRDIVKRLRAMVPKCEDPRDYTADDTAILEAADEIERLRAAAGGVEGGEGLSVDDMTDVIRAALCSIGDCNSDRQEVAEFIARQVYRAGGERGGEQASPPTETGITLIHLRTFED